MSTAERAGGVLPAGAVAPEFTLRREDGTNFTRADLEAADLQQCFILWLPAAQPGKRPRTRPPAARFTSTSRT